MNFSPDLMCGWLSWRPVKDGCLWLELPEGQCCDMRGAIRIASVLIPGVSRILVTSGGAADVEYRQTAGRWYALDCRQQFGHFDVQPAKTPAPIHSGAAILTQLPPQHGGAAA